MPRSELVRHRSFDVGDLLIGAALFVFTVAYLALLPRHLGATDEGLFLYEATRLLHGEVFYRDMFQIITPGGQYVMALLFRIFGTDIAVAKIADACLHASIALSIYAASRMRGAARTLGLAGALAHIAFGFHAWPNASAHWITTFLVMLLVLLFLSHRPFARLAWAALAGVVVGCIVCTQQQKGLVFGAGLLPLFFFDALLRRRFFGSRVPLGAAVRYTTAFVAGGIGIVVPFVAFLIARAGFDPVYQALIVFPFKGYRHSQGSAWGGRAYLTAHIATYTNPTLLKYSPVVLAFPVVTLLVGWLRKRDVDALRDRASLLLLSLLSIASILYNPDFIHITFIMPVLYVVGADALQSVFGTRIGRFSVRFLAPAVGALLMLIDANHLYGVTQRLRRETVGSADTAFGRVDFANEIAMNDALSMGRLLDVAPSREIFVYPAYPALYLLAGGRNVTRFQLLLRGYSLDEHFREAIESLKHSDALVVVSPFLPGSDPFLDYVKSHYERVLTDETPAMLVVYAKPEIAQRYWGAGSNGNDR